MFPGTISQTRWFCLFILMFNLLLLFAYDSSTLAHAQAKNNQMITSAHINSVAANAVRSEPAAAKPNPAAAAKQPDPPAESAFSAFLLKDMSVYPSMEVVATGYFAGKESTGKSPEHPDYGITYSGVKVRRSPGSVSTIAADPKVFPMGTILYIPGYGLGVVADTGSAIKGKKIDLYFATKDQVYKEWGKKTVKVYIISKGQGKVTEIMLDRLNDLLTSKHLASPAA